MSTKKEANEMQAMTQPKLDEDENVKNKRVSVRTASSGESEGVATCSYSVVVRTSCESRLDDGGLVLIQLVDKEGNESDKSRLRFSVTHRSKFKAGHSDLFVFANQQPLSDLVQVKVWFQKKRNAVGNWKLHSINVIKHDDEHILYRFPYGDWVGKDKETEVWSETALAVEGKPFQVLHEKDFSLDY